MRSTTTYLSLRMRALAPKRLRDAYRALRAPEAIPLSHGLTQEQVGSCRVFADRVCMLSALPKNGTVAELGTQRGDFAREIVRHATPKTLHLVDVDFTSFVPDGLNPPQVERHEGLTQEVMAHFPDATFDWIYIDADHSFGGVAGDAEVAARKVRPGGYLVFNDFAHIDPYLGRYGVHAAVTTFAATRGWPIAMFAFQPSALYDIALQRPA